MNVYQTTFYLPLNDSIRNIVEVNRSLITATDYLWHEQDQKLACIVLSKCLLSRYHQLQSSEIKQNTALNIDSLLII